MSQTITPRIIPPPSTERACEGLEVGGKRAEDGLELRGLRLAREKARRQLGVVYSA